MRAVPGSRTASKHPFARVFDQPVPDLAPATAGAARTEPIPILVRVTQAKTTSSRRADPPRTFGKLATTAAAPTAFTAVVGGAFAIALLLAGGTGPVLRRVAVMPGASAVGTRARPAVAAGLLALGVAAAAAVAFALSLAVALLL